ncbi:MAG: hypothetical protein AAF502_06780 [Bacteroidota bacterium]
MRKLILNVAMSLNGFIEGPNGEYDWCFTGQDYGLNDHPGKTVDQLVQIILETGTDKYDPAK